MTRDAVSGKFSPNSWLPSSDSRLPSPISRLSSLVSRKTGDRSREMRDGWRKTAMTREKKVEKYSGDVWRAAYNKFDPCPALLLMFVNIRSWPWWPLIIPELLEGCFFFLLIAHTKYALTKLRLVLDWFLFGFLPSCIVGQKEDDQER